MNFFVLITKIVKEGNNEFTVCDTKFEENLKES